MGPVISAISRATWRVSSLRAGEANLMTVMWEDMSSTTWGSGWSDQVAETS